MNYKWNEGEVVFEQPPIVYNFNIDRDGNIVELFSPIFKDKYGEVFSKPESKEEIDYLDLLVALLDENIYASLTECNQIKVVKDGVCIEVRLIKGKANKENSINQIKFSLEELRKEKESILERTVKDFQKQISQHWYDISEGKL